MRLKLHTGLKHLFILGFIILYIFPAKSQDAGKMDISEIHALVETYINYSRDSSFILLEIASNKIDQLQDEDLVIKYSAENNLRRADCWSGLNLDTSKAYLRKAQAYYIEHVDNKKLAELYALKGQITKNEGGLSSRSLYESMPYFDTAMVYAQRNNSPTLLAFVSYEKAFTLQLAERWHESFEIALQATRYAELSKDSLTMATSYFLIGRTYHHFGLFNSSEAYIAKSIQYGKGMFQIYSIIHIYADVLFQNGKDDLALANYEQALKISLEKKDTSKAVMIYTNIGQTQLNKGDFKGAEATYFAMQDLIKDSTKYAGSRTLLFSAQIHHYWGDNKQAMEGLKLFKSRYSSATIRPRNIDVYKEAADLFSSLGQTDESSKFYKKWGTLKDSLYSYTSRLQLSDLEKMYLSERGKNEELSASKRQLATMGSLLILVILLGGGLVYFIRMKGLKENQVLKFSLKEKQLEQLMNAQETERQRLARELHDGIGQSLAALKMQLQFDKNPKASDTTVQRVDDICNEVRSLSHQMMPIVLKENGLQSAIEQLTKHSFSASSIEVDFVTLGLHSRLPDNIEVNVYRITQELISNILRHSKASKVGIQLLKRSKMLLLIVEDDGKGFRIVDKSEGIGLSNINVRLEALGGTLQIQSSNSEGTYIHIAIPTSAEVNKRIA